MSSKLQLVSVMVLAAFLAGCGSTKTGSIDPGGNGGNNGGQNGGGDNGGGDNGGGDNGGGDNGGGDNGGGDNGGGDNGGGDNGGGDNGTPGNQTRIYEFRNGYRSFGPNLVGNLEEFGVEVSLDENGAINGIKSVDGNDTGTWEEVQGGVDSRRTFTDGDRFLQLDITDNYQIGGFGSNQYDTVVAIAGTRSTGALDFDKQVSAGGKYQKDDGFKGTAYMGAEALDVVGNVSMDVDWDGMGWRTSGDITNIRVEENPGISASIELHESDRIPESANSASASYTGDVTLTINGVAQQRTTDGYHGGFYGDDAAATAGVVRAEGDVGGNAVTVIGGYGADKQ